jgi:hypothetical protein
MIMPPYKLLTRTEPIHARHLATVKFEGVTAGYP